MLKSIDIRTTQNVTITYEHAHLRERILAFILDYVFLISGVSLLYLLLMSVSMNNTVAMIYEAVVIGFITSFYTLFFESVYHGQTPGKMLMKIKVVRLDGKQPEFYDYLLRWTFRLVDIWTSLGTLACILISSHPHSQRFGDIVANTIVVRIKSRADITLAEILKIDDRISYEPQYPDIRNFREEDIVLIKQALERYQRYKNNAHKSAVLEICDVLSNRLKLSGPPANKLEFLKTCIKDYIVLTR